MRDRNGVNLGRRGCGEKPGGVEKGEIRMYCVRKYNLFLIKGKHLKAYILRKYINLENSQQSEEKKIF